MPTQALESRPAFSFARCVALGVVLGLQLSALRVPTGLDALQALGPDGASAGVFRAAGLFAVAAALGLACGLDRRFSTRGLVLGCAIGFALHGAMARFVGIGAAQIDSRERAALWFLGGALLSWWIGRDGQASAVTHGEPNERSTFGALGLLGIGAALSLEGLARPLRLLGTALPSDDTCFGATLLAWVLLGSLVSPRVKPTHSAPLAVLAIAAVPLAAGAGLFGLSSIGGPDALARVVAQVGGDLSAHGSPAWNFALASRAFAIPALLLGSALAWLSQPQRIASVAAGAGVGQLLATPLLGATAAVSAAAGEGAVNLGGLIAYGTGAGALGLAWTSFGTRGSGRIAGLALAAALLAVGYDQRSGRAVSLSPWYQAPVVIVDAWDTAEGLLTVERSRDGTPIATLNRRRLTPTSAEELAETDEWAAAWALARRPEQGPVRALLVGVLTPARQRWLDERGLSGINRTSAWHEHIEAVELALGVDSPSDGPGRVLSLRQARGAIDSNSYDLVLASPVFGPLLRPAGANDETWGTAPALATGAVGSESGTSVVLWTSSALAPGAPIGSDVLLAGPGPTHITLGYINTAAAERMNRLAQAERPTAIRLERRTRTSADLSECLAPALERTALRRAHTLDALRAQCADPLVLGLAQLASVQSPSSPFETPEQALEIDRAALAHLRTAGSAPHPGRGARRLLARTASILAGKRMPTELLETFADIARAHPSWSGVQRALAAAHAELLRPDLAADALELALKSEPLDLALAGAAAEWRMRAGEDERARLILEQALVNQPQNRALRRLLAAAQVRLGEPAGGERVERLLAEDPEDDPLRAWFSAELEAQAQGRPAAPLELLVPTDS